jgi:DNA polymerase III alpha subunit
VKIDGYNRVLISEEEALNALYNHGELNFDNFFLEDPTIITQYNEALTSNADDFEKLKTVEEINLNISDYDLKNQVVWFYPDSYKTLDIETWLYDQCQNETEVARVSLELTLFEKYKLRNVLIYLKFLVDTMRKNQIVWGVGRGSSVCSFVLYLIGISKVNPIKYGLDINEFLK